jgi:hypothetical protein
LNEIRFEDQMGGEGIFSKTYLVGWSSLWYKVDEKRPMPTRILGAVYFVGQYSFQK